MPPQVRDLLYPTIPRHVRWGAQAAAVFGNLTGDFMTNVVPVVDELLAAGECRVFAHGCHVAHH